MKHQRTCKDYDYTGVKCCPICHEYVELVTIKVDGKQALVCCTFRKFFYPNDPSIGLSPEERLLRAIFGEKSTHDPDDFQIEENN